MTDQVFPPFSARNRGGDAQIDDACPDTTRIGLIHILHQLLRKRYVENLDDIAAEIQRIARVRPDQHHDSEELLLRLDWYKVYDFCERLYGHVVRDIVEFNSNNGQLEVVTSKLEVQHYIAREIRQLFLEENLAFEFSNGLVRRKGRRHTSEQVSRAEMVLGDPKLSKAKEHFNKALRYFRSVSQPDYENVVKEAVCAVESAARVFYPAQGSTLGDILK